jgi:hypothetical protein
MKIPGFVAEASLYKTSGQYRVAGTPNGFTASGVQPQLSSGQLAWCRLACAYCRYYGVYCWPCYFCGWIIVLGG